MVLLHWFIQEKYREDLWSAGHCYLLTKTFLVKTESISYSSTNEDVCFAGKCHWTIIYKEATWIFFFCDKLK